MKWPVLHCMTVANEDDRSELTKQLETDWPGRFCAHVDVERRGMLYNHREAVNCMLADDHRWSLICSDDAVLLPGALDALEQVMVYAPAPFVSLCHFSTYGEKNRKRGAAFATSDHCTWGQAILFEAKVRKSYARLVNDVWDMDAATYHKWDDGLPTVHNLLHGTTACMTTRALFQHADIGSILGNNLGHWRHAHSTVEDPGPPWTAPFIPPSGTTVREQHRQLARELYAYRKARAAS